MSSDVQGRCLCGGVTFEARVTSHDVSVCHCSMCNRWSGGMSLFLEVVGAPEFAGTDNIGVYRSSEWGERGFCKVCGSSLFWKLAGEDRCSVSAGALDCQNELHLTTEIYVDDKPGYYAFANDTVKLSGEQAQAAYLAAGKKD